MARIAAIFRARECIYQLHDAIRHLTVEEVRDLHQDQDFRALLDAMRQEPNVEEEMPPTRYQRTKFTEMAHPLQHGALVIHTTSNGHQAIGVYNRNRGMLEFEGIGYNHPSGFCREVERRYGARRTFNTNGWEHCDVLVNGAWVGLSTMRY